MALDNDIFDGVGANNNADASVIQIGTDNTVQLPEGVTVNSDSFAREGHDLVITKSDGSTAVVEDYFASEPPATLTTETGGRLSGNLVTKLAGPENPGEYAQAGGPQLGEPIGHVDQMDGEVTVIRSDGTKVTLEVGDPVYQGDALETGPDGAVGIILADQTTFSMAENGSMVLDEMVYDPGTAEGSMNFSVVKGVFTFVSGQVAKTDPDAMTIETPVATIGIRGTQVGVDFANGEDLQVVLMEESDGFVGEIVVWNEGGTNIINMAGFGTIVNGFGLPPIAAFEMPEQDLIDIYGTSLQYLPTEVGTGNDYGMQEMMDIGEDDLAALTDFETAAGGNDEPDNAQTAGSDAVEGDYTGRSEISGLDTGGTSGTTGGSTNNPGFSSGTGESDSESSSDSEPGDNPSTGSYDYIDENGVRHVGLGDETTFSDPDSTDPISIDESDNTNSLNITTGSGNDNIITGSGNDTISSGDGDDYVDAGAGNDFVDAAHGGGNDTYVGGEGNDTIDFDSSSDGVVVDLEEGTATDAADAEENLIDNDNLSGFENVIGGEGDDEIRGDSGDNILSGGSDANREGDGDDILDGRAGDDTLDGGGGDDQLIGGAGDDVLNGGAGSDTAIFNGNWNDYTVSANDDGSFTVSGPDGADTVSNIETLTFDDATFTFDGETFVTTSETIETNSETIDSGDATLVGSETEDVLNSGEESIDEETGDTVTTYDTVTTETFEQPTVTTDYQRTVTTETAINGSVSVTYGEWEETGTTDGSRTYTETIEATRSEVTDVNDAPDAGDVTLTGAEDTALVITEEQLLANSSDEDSDDLSVTSVNGDDLPGTLTDNEDGTWTFTPNADWNGSLDISFTVSDGFKESPATVSLDFEAVNDGPVAEADTASGTENEALTIDVLANDTDVDSDNLSVMNATVEGGGSVSVNDDGTIEFDPGSDFDSLAAGETAEATISYDVSDGDGGTDTGTATVTITGANDGPVALDRVAETDEKESVSGQLTATDVDSDNLTFSLADEGGPAHGTVEIAADGSYTYTPAEGFSGADSFTYQVDDGDGGTTTATVSVTVNEVDGIQIGGDEADTLVGGEGEDTIDGGGGDDTLTGSDGDDTLVGGEDDDNIDGGAGNDNITGSSGDDTIDGGDDVDTAVMSGSYADYTVTKQEDGSVNVEGPDGSDTLTNVETINFAGDGTSLNLETGELSGTEGADTIVGSAQGETIRGLGGDDTITGGEGDDIVDGGEGNDTLVAAHGGGDDTYDGGDGEDTVTFESAENGVNVNLAEGTATDASDVEYIGTDFLTNIENVVGSLGNDHITGNDQINALYGGEGADVLEGGAGDDVLDGGEGSDTAVFSGNSADYSLTANEDGTFTVTGQNGSDTISNIESLQFDNGTFTFDGETFSKVTTDPVTEVREIAGTEYLSDAGEAQDVIGSDPDYSEPDPETGDVTVTYDTVTVNTYSTPYTNVTYETTQTTTEYIGGETDVTYGDWVATDETSPSDRVDTRTEEIDGTRTEIDVNDAPDAGDVTLTGAEDTALVITEDQLLANSSDTDSEGLSVTSVSGENLPGTLEQTGEGEWTFTPNDDWNGSLDISFTVSDGYKEDAGTATITLADDGTDVVTSTTITQIDVNTDYGTETLSGSETADVPNSETSTTDQETGDVTTVYDTVTTETYSKPYITTTSQRSVTTETLEDGTVNTIYGDWIITDTDTGTETRTVTTEGTREVIDVNETPDAGDVTLTGGEDTALVITEEQLLANASDADGDNLSVTSVSGDDLPGTLVQTGEGEWTFTPDANWNGSLDLTYTVSDGFKEDTGTATVNLSDDNADSTFVTTYQTNSETVDVGEASLAGSESDDVVGSGVDTIDPETGDTITTYETTVTNTYSQPTQTTNYQRSVTVETTEDGTVLDPVYGTWTETSSSEGSRTYTETVEGDPRSEVTDVNETPEAVADTANGGENEALTIDVLSNDTDADGDTLTVTSATVEGGGSVSINDDGTLAFDPGSDFDSLADGSTATATITYMVSDGYKESSNTVTVTVNGTNDGPVFDALVVDGSVDDDNLVGMGEDDTFSAILEASDADTGDELTYSIGSEAAGPAHGQVSFGANGAFTYTPDENYNGEDEFTVTISDKQGSSTTATIKVDVAAVNDAATVSTPSLVVSEGATVGVGAADLGVSDVDTADAGVTIQVSNVSNGAFMVDGVESSTFTLADVADGKVSFTHDGGEDAPTFSVSASDDGENFTDPVTAQVSFTNVNDAPELTTDLQAYFEAGQALTLDSSELNVTDAESGPDNITYTLTDAPDFGALYKVDAEGTHIPLEINDTFTQADINSGSIQYQQDSSEFNFEWEEDTPSWDDATIGVDSGNLTVPDGATSMTVTFQGEEAGYKNSLGWYKIVTDPETGETTYSDPEIIWHNASQVGSGGDLEVDGSSVTFNNLSAGEEIGFFIIQNAEDKVTGRWNHSDGGDYHNLDSLLNNEQRSLEFNSDGDLIVTSPGSIDLTVDARDIFHSGNASSNEDGMVHVKSGIGDDGELHIGFEDLDADASENDYYYQNDNDFDDVKFSVSFDGPSQQTQSDSFTVTAEDGDGYQVAEDGDTNLTFSLDQSS